MRMVQRPVFEENGFPWIGVVKLGKDSSVAKTQIGFIWNGYGVFEKTPKSKWGTGSGAMGFTALPPLSEQCRAWPKGTVLFVAGEAVEDDYWTKKNGKMVYKVIVNYIAEQLDYAAMFAEEHKCDGSSGYEKATLEEDKNKRNDYMPGF